MWVSFYEFKRWYAHVCLYIHAFACVCGEGCGINALWLSCTDSIPLSLLGLAPKVPRADRRSSKTYSYSPNTRLKCLYPVFFYLTHNTLVVFPLWLTVYTFSDCAETALHAASVSEVSHSVWKRMKHLEAHPSSTFCTCLHNLRPCGYIRLSRLPVPYLCCGSSLMMS